MDTMIPDPQTVSPRPLAIRYGLILGGISAALNLVLYLGGINPGLPDTGMGVKIGLGIMSFVITLAVLVMGIKEHRDKELGGYISLGRGMGVGTLIGLFSGLVGLVWMLLFSYVIAPDYFETMRTGIMDQASEQSGMDAEAAEQAMGIMEWFINPVVTSITQLLGSIFWGFLIGLIAGAVLRRDRPNA